MLTPLQSEPKSFESCLLSLLLLCAFYRGRTRPMFTWVHRRHVATSLCTQTFRKFASNPRGRFQPRAVRVGRGKGAEKRGLGRRDDHASVCPLSLHSVWQTWYKKSRWEGGASSNCCDLLRVTLLDPFGASVLKDPLSEDPFSACVLDPFCASVLDPFSASV